MGYAAAMLANTASQFQDLPNYQAWINALGAQLDDLLEAATQVMTNLVLQNASGIQVDQLGAVLNQSRNGLSDSDYRSILQVKIVQYQAQGSVEDLIQLMQTLGNATQVNLLESFPAKILMTVFGLNPSISDSDLVTAMNSAKPAGVGLVIQTPITLPVFQFDQPITSENAGFDEGHFVGILT